MQDKVVIITGASDGIGAIAAAELVKKGATVGIVGRSPEKTKRVADTLGVPYYIADFSKLSEVRALAETLKRQYSKIDVLINNAGGSFGKRELTEDGIEKNLQVNHVAPFLLTSLLMDTLISSQATIINTSSVASRALGKIDLNDLNLEKDFTAFHAYGNGKLGNVLFTKGLQQRYGDKGIHAVAVHPGNVATNFASEGNAISKLMYHTFLNKIILITPEKGAEPLVWLATSKPGKDWEQGGYYERFKIGKLNPQAADTQFVTDFWEATKKLIITRSK
jgi:NAD(P)-dependent dehydrogenase (short-subunit alcohol dehydrogenase family)